MESGNVTSQESWLEWLGHWDHLIEMRTFNLTLWACHQLLCFDTRVCVHVFHFLDYLSQQAAFSLLQNHCMLSTGQDGVPSIFSQHYYPTSPSMQQRDFTTCFCPLKIFFFSFLSFVLISLIYQNTTPGGLKSDLFGLCLCCFLVLSFVCLCWPQTWDLRLRLPGAESQVYTTHSIFNLPFCWESLLPPAERSLLCMSDPSSLLFPL